MERFVHNANIEHYRRLIAESEFDPSRDEIGTKSWFAGEVGQGQEAPQLVSLLASAWIAPSNAWCWVRIAASIHLNVSADDCLFLRVASGAA